ncbi:MAG: CHASE3 domain-containing protein, partial [Candidatus Acidiferrales bacterium]
LFAARASTLSYILTGSSQPLQEFEQARKEIPTHLAELSRLTVDNPSQQSRIAALKPLIDRRMGRLAEAIAIHDSGQENLRGQQQLAISGEAQASEIRQSLLNMENEEEKLLQQRQKMSDQKYSRVQIVLVIAFVATLLLLFLNFQRLLVELKDRERAEEAVRRLSGRILQIQDEERRRIARELHDSIGQLFVALKLNLGRHESGPDTEQAAILSESLQMLEQGIVEVRTLSHLLHPPLLDEMGFASAAEWFVEGFSKRSKLKVNLDLPPQMPRMPRIVELALFRVLQESLTNVHRHAKSPSVDIRIERAAEQVKLSVRDHGTGIPAELLESFNRTGIGAGVGLAGMRERMIDLGGTMELESDEHGTRLLAIVPLPERRERDRHASDSSLSPESSGGIGAKTESEGVEKNRETAEGSSLASRPLP